MADGSGSDAKKEKDQKGRSRTDGREVAEAEPNPFVVTDTGRTEDSDTRKGMKTSEEINIYDVGDAPVIDYVRDQQQKVMEHDDKARTIELDAESIEHIDITKARYVKVDGKSTRDDLTQKVKADFKFLENAKPESGEDFRDVMRNIDEYHVICHHCRGSMNCAKCGGSGKKGLLFKCDKCGGSGLCRHCDERESAECPRCETELSVYATKCRSCGASFNCPSCFTPIPSTATRCLHCRTEFRCKKCRSLIMPARDERCISCGTREWFKRPERKVPIRKTERGKNV